MVCEHRDGRLSLRYGPHLLGRYDAEGICCRRKLRRLERPKQPESEGCTNALTKR
jgi:hypothetical protein